MTREDRVVRVEAAIAREAGPLLGYLMRRVDGPEDAADVLSETFLIVWKKAASLPAVDDEVRPWLFAIARNALLHHYRSGTRRRAAADRLRHQIHVDATTGFVETPATDALHAALTRLDPVDQEIVTLIHWDGLSLVEVSRAMAMKEGTVRSRYHRARARLRAALVSSEVLR